MKKQMKLTLAMMMALTCFLTGCSSEEASAPAPATTPSASAPAETPSTDEADTTEEATEETTETATSDDGQIVIAMELAFPPFETKDDNGDPMGVSVDIGNAFGEYIGKEVVIENTAWDGLIPSLETGAADLIISSMTKTEARMETVDFTDAYANALLALLINVDSEITEIDDLNQDGKIVAVKLGSTGHNYAMEHLPNAEIVALADESACVLEVTQGKADGFIYDQLTIYRNSVNNPDTTSAIFLPFQEPEEWCAAAKKGNTEIVEQFNEFLADFIANGGYDAITETHLSEEKEAFDSFGFQWFFDFA